MVRRDVVAQKVAAAQARLAAADPIFAKPRDEFLATDTDRDVAMFYLFLAIQECIDLAAHWVVDEEWGPPEDAGDSFDILRDKSVLDADLARALRSATGLRNRIGHGYGFLDPGRTHDEYPEGSKALRRFLSIVADAAGI
jgi:uncharacterized protein YutE (UPF0331/DUF86 family)